jgi:hypothetical protein
LAGSLPVDVGSILTAAIGFMDMENRKHSANFRTRVKVHMKTNYSNAPGCKLLGIRDAKPMPLEHPQSRDLMVVGRGEDGEPVCISREEALLKFWMPTPAQIEERKRECDFLYPHNARSRRESESEKLTISLLADPRFGGKKKLS